MSQGWTSVKIEDLMTASVLILDADTMTAMYKSILADRAWQYYLDHKTEENHARYLEICERLFNDS